MSVHVSIASHGHGPMVGKLIQRLCQFADVSAVVVTCNIPEEFDIPSDGPIEIIDNPSPKGFSANHNAAFRSCRAHYFCVLNPDVVLPENPFPSLLSCLKRTQSALVAPVLLSPNGGVEDSARHFPTFWSLLVKAMGGRGSCYPIVLGQAPTPVDWIAGAFMLFRSADFARLGGFDERYYLYYEDVDICARAWDAGMKVVVCPTVSVIHDARRASRKNLRHMRWHLASMARYLWTGRRFRA